MGFVYVYEALCVRETDQLIGELFPDFCHFYFNNKVDVSHNKIFSTLISSVNAMRHCEERVSPNLCLFDHLLIRRGHSTIDSD